MSFEDAENRPLDAIEADLVRHACDGTPLSEAAAGRLAGDPGLQRELAEDVALASQLREALRPGPLAPQTEARIWARIDAEQVGDASVRRRGWRSLAGAAVAAALLFGVLVPQMHEPAPQPVDSIAQTDTGLTQMLSTLVVQRWDATVEPALEDLSEDVTAISQRIERASPDDSLLPWAVEDDWDLPPAEDA